MASRAALAATRSLDILNFLATNPGQSYSLTELARALDVNPSSMLGIVNTMTTAGYLTRHPFQKTYRLGPVSAAIGLAALGQDARLGLATDEVARLGSELDVEAVVTTAVNGDMVTLASAGPPAGQFLSFVGQRVDHIPPVGSIFVAWADDDVIEDWLARAQPPLSDADRLAYRDVLTLVRAEGQAVVTLVERSWRFAISADLMTPERELLCVSRAPESLHRLYYVGVPVFDAEGGVLFGLFATGTSTPIGVERIGQLADRLHDAASGIMGSLGASAPA